MNERILLIRKNANLTQKDFADRIGVKRNTVAVYESGGCNVSDSVIKMICREFSINESWLRSGEGDMYVPVEDETAAIVSSLLEKKSPVYDMILDLLRTYEKLDDKSRIVFDSVVSDLIDNAKREG